jgi:hypothetical protein
MAERRPALPALEALHTPALAEYRARQGLACLARPQKVPRPASPIFDIAFAQNHDT